MPPLPPAHHRFRPSRVNLFETRPKRSADASIIFSSPRHETGRLGENEERSLAGEKR